MDVRLRGPAIGAREGPCAALPCTAQRPTATATTPYEGRKPTARPPALPSPAPSPHLLGPVQVPCAHGEGRDAVVVGVVQLPERVVGGAGTHALRSEQRARGGVGVPAARDRMERMELVT